MKKVLLSLIFLGMILGFGSSGYAVPAVDIIQFPTPYFLDVEANRTSSPYYRWWNQDWGWTHSAIGTPFTTATLNISSFDVDWSEGADGEHDRIKVWDTSLADWRDIGELAGSGSTWSYAAFSLDSSLFDEIAAGLQVWMDIDSTHTQNWWAVTLAKSVLSLDEGELPGPGPGRVPEPATMLLLGSGLIGLVGFARRSFKK